MLNKAHREESLLKTWGKVRRQAAQHLLDLEDLLQRLDPNKVGVKDSENTGESRAIKLECERNAIIMAADEEIKMLRQTVKKERERTRELEAQRDKLEAQRDELVEVILLQEQVIEQDINRQIER